MYRPQEASARVEEKLQKVSAEAHADAQEQQRLAAALSQLRSAVPELLDCDPDALPLEDATEAAYQTLREERQKLLVRAVGCSVHPIPNLSRLQNYLCPSQLM